MSECPCTIYLITYGTHANNEFLKKLDDDRTRIQYKLYTKPFNSLLGSVDTAAGFVKCLHCLLLIFKRTHKLIVQTLDSKRQNFVIEEFILLKLVQCCNNCKFYYDDHRRA